MSKALAIASLLAHFGLGPEPDLKAFGTRRGRVYGGGSKAYDGPREAGRKRPAPAPLAKAWRKARAAA